MVTWNSVNPDGTKSVKANESIGQSNTTYIETEMDLDHYWNFGEDEDGRHRMAQMPKYVDGVVATPTSPTIAAGMDIAYFARLKTAIESVAQQDVQPYARNASAIMQLLGIRACGVINVPAGVFSVKYKHNCTITRTGVGRFTVTFTTALPSNNYLFLGSALAASSTTNDVITCAVEANTTFGNVKTTTFVKFRTVLTTGSSSPSRATADPFQAYFVVFGG